MVKLKKEILSKLLFGYTEGKSSPFYVSQGKGEFYNDPVRDAYPDTRPRFREYHGVCTEDPGSTSLPPDFPTASSNAQIRDTFVLISSIEICYKRSLLNVIQRDSPSEGEEKLTYMSFGYFKDRRYLVRLSEGSLLSPLLSPENFLLSYFGYFGATLLPVRHATASQLSCIPSTTAYFGSPIENLSMFLHVLCYKVIIAGERLDVC